MHKGVWKDSHVKFCIQQPSLVKAIEVAASAINENGTIHSHQRRPYSKSRFEKFAHQLKGVEREISQVKIFDELIQIVNSQRFPYIGDLMVYDTALRIGAYLKIEPEIVYLHNGTRIGTKNLLDKIKGNTIKKEVFVFIEPAFSRLCPADIENFLCINKDQIKNFKK